MEATENKILRTFGFVNYQRNRDFGIPAAKIAAVVKCDVSAYEQRYQQQRQEGAQ